jgi:hypothetical protein
LISVLMIQSLPKSPKLATKPLTHDHFGGILHINL